ncbi:MAG TPA: VOC family protein [Anaerolineales bacterium]|nr:VOC family protein [Anaerolineales bacterium]HRK88933.1 VOC family protein [Anaerolineales bacterium]
MTKLYPSWIEIPAHNLDRAIAFYKVVFNLEDIPVYDDYPPARIAVLHPSDKSVQNPGVSLVQSPTHVPSKHGILINFHVGDHANLEKAVEMVLANSGSISEPLVDMGDGVKYLVILDSEGNSIALSSYEPIEGEESSD